eukprot:1146559-Pelagomonas_calceolata.AAC.5
MGQCGEKWELPNLSPFCQVHPRLHSSDTADTIAKEMGSIGGLAGSWWARTSGAIGWPLSPNLF